MRYCWFSDPSRFFAVGTEGVGRHDWSIGFVIGGERQLVLVEGLQSDVLVEDLPAYELLTCDRGEAPLRRGVEPSAEAFLRGTGSGSCCKRTIDQDLLCFPANC